MPIDPMMLDPMLGTFRNMVEKCKANGSSGEDFDQMVSLLGRMESLGQEHSDFNAFNGAMMQENLMGRFSDHYGRVLSGEAKEATQASEDGGYDDAALLKQTVDALKDAVKRIKDGYQEAIDVAGSHDANASIDAAYDYMERNLDSKEFEFMKGADRDKMREESKKQVEEELEEKPNMHDSTVEVEVLQDPTDLIKPIEDLIALGEQDGMTLPKFLRIQIETGMDKAMEGTVVQRKALDRALAWAQSDALTPFHIEKAERHIKVFEDLAAENKFGVPNSKELSWATNDVDRDIEPKIIEWTNVQDRIDSLLFALSFWSLSYCEFAPYLPPWSLAPDKFEAVKNTQNTTPGDFKIKEEQLMRYYGISFHDMFKHPSFAWDVKHDHMGYSQEYVEWLIEKCYPACIPLQHLPSDLIAERAHFYGDTGRNKVKFTRETNPRALEPAKRSMAFYDSQFGEGRYVSKFGPITEIRVDAAPWNWETFKYK